MGRPRKELPAYAPPARKPLETMTSLDAGICLEHAQAVDPLRGCDYIEAFWDKAEALGYRYRADALCKDCPHPDPGTTACPMQCGYVRPAVAPGPVVPFPCDDEHPGDGIIRG